MSRNAVLLVLVVAFGGLLAGSARAGPIPPSPSPPPSVGESLMTSSPFPPGVGPLSFVNADWMVLPAAAVTVALPTGLPPAGSFVYFYQVENPITNTPPLTAAPVEVDIFTVTTGVVPIIASGVLLGDNLDVATPGIHPGHNPVEFPSLVGEIDPPLAPFPGGTVDGFTAATTGPGNVTFDGSGSFVPPGFQSNTVYFVSAFPPVYGFGSAQNGAPSPWTTSNPGGQPIPVPTPEPSTGVLVGLALPLAFLYRRVKARASRRRNIQTPVVG